MRIGEEPAKGDSTIWATQFKGVTAICPECRDTKHGNCIGYALQVETDMVVPCGCAHSEK